MMGKLIIARHQESEWNKLGIWTGIRDRHLTEHGFEESKDIGLLIKDLKVDYAFASMQVRSIETLSCMLNVCEQYEVPTEHSAALNERDYGDYTGKNKLEMESLLGSEEFEKLRRGWDYPVPNGESLKMVYERIVPFFLDKVLPKLEEDQNVLIVAHGNSLRALTKYIENITDEAIADLEIPFETISIYNLNKDGHMIDKEVRKLDKIKTLNKTKKRAQIIATIGPASSKHEIMKKMLIEGVSILRLNFSWGNLDFKVDTISISKKIGQELGRHIPIIVDLPGPRIQENAIHTYDKNALSAITAQDREFIKFAALHDVDYLAVSFVGGPEDIFECKKVINSFSGKQKIIAKIERKIALEKLEQIIEVADAVMVARGDLGNEIPIEQIPFIQDNIIKTAKNLNKPVIVATQMLFSMVDNIKPTRAEVTDVENAILEGADAIMLSEETAIGKNPIAAVSIMAKIAMEAEKHINDDIKLNLL
jgi:bisphosphoglycerate-dependent phosphoglycerate mutase